MKRVVFVIAFISLPAMAQLTMDTAVWETDTTIDDFTDEITTQAMIIAEGGPDAGFIHLMCKGSYFEVKVSASEYIGDKDIPNNVLYRVDKNDAVKTTMKPTSKKYVYFNDLDSQFLQQLMNGKDSVIIQLTSYDYDKSKAKFTLNGSTAAIQKVLDACESEPTPVSDSDELCRQWMSNGTAYECNVYKNQKIVKVMVTRDFADDPEVCPKLANTTIITTARLRSEAWSLVVTKSGAAQGSLATCKF